MKLSAALILLCLATGRATHAQPNGQTSKDQKSLRVALPGKPWALQIETSDFAIESNEIKPDGRAFLLANDTPRNFTLTVTLQQVRELATLDGCRQAFEDRMASYENLKPVDVKQWQNAEMVILEFVFPEVSGIPVQQKNVFACLVNGDVYAEIHLSKVRFQADEAPLFSSLLNATHFVRPEQVRRRKRPVDSRKVIHSF